MKKQREQIGIKIAVEFSEKKLKKLLWKFASIKNEIIFAVPLNEKGFKVRDRAAILALKSR